MFSNDLWNILPSCTKIPVSWPIILTIELNQVNTCFTFQQALYFATLWIGILLVNSTFFYQSEGLREYKENTT